jgi:hypothetical protein
VKIRIFQKVLGLVEYRLYPDGRAWWSGPLNGQTKRRELFESIVRHFGVGTIVETGTYYGTSTEYFSKTLNLTTLTIENHPRFASFARERFKNTNNVSVLTGDSHGILSKIIPTLETSNRVLFYLDAHCDNDDIHPLPNELEIIFELMDDPIIMIDDFAVPFDIGYYYDIYKNGLKLNLDFIASQINKLRLSAFFPSAPASDESGPRRGCVVLCRGNDLPTMEAIPQLWRWGAARYED